MNKEIIDNAIVEKIKNFVEDESKKASSRYGYEPFLFHFPFVVSYAQFLAKELGADIEVVTLAAWLHDIGSIIKGREDHNVTGAEIAEKELRRLCYPQEKIEIVKKCILNHRGSVDSTRESLEEKIIADADAMSNFDNIAGIFKAALVYENLSQEEAKKAVLRKLKKKYEKIHFERSKKLIKPKYEAVVILLG